MSGSSWLRARWSCRRAAAVQNAARVARECRRTYIAGSHLPKCVTQLGVARRGEQLEPLAALDIDNVRVGEQSLQLRGILVEEGARCRLAYLGS